MTICRPASRTSRMTSLWLPRSSNPNSTSRNRRPPVRRHSGPRLAATEAASGAKISCPRASGGKIVRPQPGGRELVERPPVPIQLPVDGCLAVQVRHQQMRRGNDHPYPFAVETSQGVQAIRPRVTVPSSTPGTRWLWRSTIGAGWSVSRSCAYSKATIGPARSVAAPNFLGPAALYSSPIDCYQSFTSRSRR